MSSRDPGVPPGQQHRAARVMDSPTGFTEEREGGRRCLRLQGLCEGSLRVRQAYNAVPAKSHPAPSSLISCRGTMTAPGTGDLLCRWLRSGGIHDRIRGQVCVSPKQRLPRTAVFISSSSRGDQDSGRKGSIHGHLEPGPCAEHYNSRS